MLISKNIAISRAGINAQLEVTFLTFRLVYRNVDFPIDLELV